MPLLLNSPLAGIYKRRHSNMRSLSGKELSPALDTARGFAVQEANSSSEVLPDPEL